MRPHKHWSSLSSSLESMCHILISPIKRKADIGRPCSPRHKLGRKSSGPVLIKQPFVNVNVRIPSGLAAMETLRLGLEPVLLNRGGRCPLLLRWGIFAVRCSRIQQLGSLSLILPAYWRGKSGSDLTAAGPSSSLPFAVTLIAVTRTGRSPGSLCPSANVLHFSSEEGEGSLEKRAAKELNQLTSSLLRAVLSRSPAWCYRSNASFSSIRPNRSTRWRRLFEPRIWLPLLADSCMTDVHKALQSTWSMCCQTWQTFTTHCCVLRLGIKKKREVTTVACQCEKTGIVWALGRDPWQGIMLIPPWKHAVLHA